MSVGYAQTTVADSLAAGIRGEPPVTAVGVDPASSWHALMAPGMLLTRSIVTLTLIVVPWLSASIYVAAGVRAAAAAMLLLHVGSTRVIVRNRQRLAANAFWGVLGIDAFASGLLLATAPQLRGPAVPLMLVVLAMSFEGGGGWGLLLCTLVMSVTAAAAAWCEVAGPVIVSTALSFSPVLSVETFFAGGPTSGAPGLSTTLSVETLFAGVPVLDRGAPLFVPALALGLIALCVGGGVSLLRVRSAVSVVGATLAADEQVTT